MYGRYDETRQNPRPFASYLHDCGIDVQCTMPCTPQQNDIAKMRNDNLLDMVRSMLANSSLLDYLWEEALRTTTYILNQVPSKSILEIHFELWLGRKPHLHYFMYEVAKLNVNL